MGNDRFIKFPSLNVGRCHHSSCSFDARFVFVICGLVIQKTQREEVSEEDKMTIIREISTWAPSNSIERFDS